MSHYERALNAAKTAKERDRLKELGIQFGLGTDSPEWVLYAMLGDLVARFEAAADQCQHAAQDLQTEKAAPRPNTLVVSQDTISPLADEIARALLVLRTDTARQVEASLHASAERVMRNIASAALAVTPKYYAVRMACLALLGVALCLFIGAAAGAYVLQTHVFAHALLHMQPAHNH